MQRKVLMLWLWLLLPSLAGYCQDPKGLLESLGDSNADTARVGLLLKIALFYRNEHLLDNDSATINIALSYYTQAAELSGRLQDPDLQDEAKTGIGRSLIMLGCGFKGKAVYREAIADYKLRRQLTKAAEALSDLADNLAYLGDSLREECIQIYQEAWGLLQQTGDQHGALHQRLKIANLDLNSGQLNDAETQLKEILRDCKLHKSPILYEVYELLTGLYKTKGDWPNQLLNGLEMIKNAEIFCPKPSLWNYYYYLGGFYSDAGMHEEAQRYLKKAVEINARYTDGTHYYDPLKSLIDELLLENRSREALDYCQKSIIAHPAKTKMAETYYSMSTGDCHLALHEIGKAESAYLSAFRNYTILSQKFRKTNYFLYSFIYGRLGKLYFAKKQYQIATSVLNKLDSIPPRIIKPAQQSSLQLLRFKVDSAIGNYPSAIAHYQLYKKINDSLLTVNKIRQIVEMQVKYETAEKEHSLSFLQSEGKIQHSELKALNLQRNVIIGTVALLMIIACLLYSNNRVKQWKNHQLKAQQQKINRQNLALQGLVVEKDKLITDKDRLLNEKDWLLKEVHHRVKNNLQIIMSLLNTQSRYLQEGSALDAIRESQNRVQSISIIHQKLYTEGNFSSIEMRSYIADLVLHLRNCYNDQTKNVSFEYDTDQIRMEVSHAIPVGLILNEAVTNAIKYAFPGRQGTVRVTLKKDASDIIVLTVSDNGIGLPATYDITKQRSLGLQMIRVLSRQLSGTMNIRRSPGVTIGVFFKYEQVSRETEISVNPLTIS
jgi:two-component sensor histidine kinase